MIGKDPTKNHESSSWIAERLIGQNTDESLTPTTTSQHLEKMQMQSVLREALNNTRAATTRGGGNAEMAVWVKSGVLEHGNGPDTEAQYGSKY